ncbi:hypothetical protein D0B54_14820 [Solimonas sp. K1W22B-7]|uniref:sensor histidine kinase n=1 Tax=Solimonas sp. K1W22B-7 TaxID=2303331 RepID=UPI000E331DAE|nr:ATP-binding protein [Solimonas sp. K1W22B-7]AXQ29871.1 hypothetical protein D0B54_14820 [Solimonas sp. K1W22B-7]
MVGDRRHWRWLLLWLLLVGASLPAAVQAEDPVPVLSGEFLADGRMQLPDDADPRWRPVALPDVWQGEERFAGGNSGWYRFRVPGPAQPQEPWALYIMRASVNVAVYFNRSFIGDGGDFDEPMSFNTNRGLLFMLPAPLLRGDDNVVHIYLRGYPYFTGLPVFDVGPLSALRPPYERRVLLQNRAGFGLMMLTLTASLFGLTFWRRHPEQPVYLWFGLSAAFWTIFCANMAFHDVPLPGRYWLALVHSGVDWSCAAQLVFVHRFLDMRRPRLEKLALGLATLGTLGNFLGDWWTLRYVGAAINLLGLASIVYCLFFAVGRWRLMPRADVLLLCAGLGLELLLALNDFLPALTSDTDRYRSLLFMMHFAAPLFLYAMAWRLIDRSMTMRRELEQLNRGLETRVAEARGALECAFEQRYGLERQQAMLEERERIHRDLHDDLGAKLLTLLHSAGNEESVELARSALGDLRDVVSLDPEDRVNLRGALAEMETEARHRAARARCRLDWHYPAGDDSIEVSSGFVFHLARILREAISNALRHGAAGSIEVVLELAGGQLRLAVGDDGRGCGGSRPGTGMRSMCARTELLRGRIHWRPRPGGGTRVELEAPLPIAIAAAG